MSDNTRTSLIQALKNPSDEMAWLKFVNRYREFIHSWCVGWCRNHDLKGDDANDVADEVTQHLMLTIREKMRSYDLEKRSKENGYRKWLKSVTRNAIIDFLEHRRRERGSGDSAMMRFLEEIEAPDDLVMGQELGQALEALTLSELLELLKPQILERVRQRDWEIAMAVGLVDGRQKTRVPEDGPCRPKAIEVAKRYGLTPAAVSQAKSRVVEAIAEILRQSGEEGCI